MLPRSSSGELYAVLELSPGCSTEEVKRQYRVMALQYHPDRTNGATTEQFKAIEEAHRTLSDPNQRALYDTFGREHMKLMGEYVPDFVRTVDAIRAILLLSSVFMALLLMSMVMIAVKVDHGSRLSWWVVCYPLWLTLPVAAAIGAGVLVEGIRHCSVELLLLGAEVALYVILCISSVAALTGSVRASRALALWLGWYTLWSVRHLYLLIPSVFTAGEQESAEAMQATEGHHATAYEPHTSTSHVWRSPFYWRAVAIQLLETSCFFTFFALAFQRASVGDGALVPGGPQQLSMWTVFTPLLVFFSVSGAINALSSLFGPRLRASARHTDESPIVVAETLPSEDIPRDDNTHWPPHGEGTANVQSTPWCERAMLALLAAVPQGCGVYMACMWAAKLEYEVNNKKDGVHPSVYWASFPMFVVLCVLTVTPCCVSCMLGLAIKGTRRTGADVSTPGGMATPTPPSHGQAAASRPAGYRATSPVDTAISGTTSGKRRDVLGAVD